ncbi:hypothetical protein [Marinobacter gelidimuriae]|uniref:hypothetical protein n=1 Tax=Marinobacter gelidimuriae TaxID=2739064 RepID=UPI0003755407|nr:hypothetical protein [Marinobacter gelidimuriae]
MIGYRAASYSDGMMMCAYAEDRPFIDPHDLKNIRKDLLGEDDEPKVKLPENAQHNRSAAPAPVSAQSTEGFGDMAKTLHRIASALESIDGRLAKMSSEGTSSKKDPVGSAGNVKPLTPFWKK